MKKDFCFILMTLVAILVSSCGSSKLVYLQDMKEGQKYAIEQFNQSVVHAGDKLGIVVTCKNPELAIPFNAANGTVAIDNGNLSTGGQGLSDGYKVDSDGFIFFPVLGRLHVEGLTLSQTSDLIKTLIVNGKYISDPTVTIEFLNFKFVTWGAIGNGVYTVDGDKITIIEALAMAGGLASNGRNDNVMVLREINGYREIYKMDLKSKDIFMSPGFYLQQNDVVYVEPKFRLNESSGGRAFTYVLTSLTTVTSFILLMWNLGYRNQ